MRVLVRRERPHPGAKTHPDGSRTTAGATRRVATDTPAGQLAWLEARHRAHARVEDRIKNLKQTGIGRFPSREFQINQTWLQLALTAADLIAWTQTTLLDGDLAKAEPKTAALPAAARRRPPRPRPTPHQDQDRHRLALGRPARRRVPPPRADLDAAGHLTSHAPDHPPARNPRRPGHQAGTAACLHAKINKSQSDPTNS